MRRGDVAMCDRYFIKEPGEWFHTVDNNEMVNNETRFFECGTQYSIYMKGIFLFPIFHLYDLLVFI